ncbi:MAG: hypothetical protein V4736_08475 [Bdellovibrionota bacterium]
MQFIREAKALAWKGLKLHPIIKCTDAKTNFTWKKNFEDLKKIKQAYTDYGIQLSVPEIKQWFTDQGPYSQWHRIWQSQGRRLEGRDKSLFNWIERGAIRSFIKVMTHKPVSAYDIIRGWSAQDEWKNNLLGLLFRAANSYTSVIRYDEQRNILTPFVAKTILFENLRMKLTPEQFNNLANQLELKISYRSEFNERVIPLAFNDTITIHNGYVYGAAPEMALDYMGVQQSSRGIDCSTLVQACVEEILDDKLESNDSRIRLTTNRLFQIMDRDWRGLSVSFIKNMQDNFEFEPLTSEEQLQPGDIFFSRGHIVIFGGYERLNGEWVPVTYEAKGGEHRLTGRYQRHFKSKRGCEKPFLSRVGEKVYFLRLSRFLEN